MSLNGLADGRIYADEGIVYHFAQSLNFHVFFQLPRKRRCLVSAGGDASWTFLTNHAHTLILLAAESELPLREVALRVDITERAVGDLLKLAKR